MKRVIVLGSTGSIGTSTLEVIDSLQDRMRVVALAANRSWKKLCGQAWNLRPEAVCISDESCYADLKRGLDGCNIEIFCGEHGLREMAYTTRAELAVCGIMGAAGLSATIECVRSGKTVALANKEALVVGGPMLTKLAADRGVTILPVDSEHSAVHQILRGAPGESVRRVILTASGGPFVDWSPGRTETATVEEALNHPTWKMGPKITIDSATLMNKALEVIEAHWLFGLRAEQIEVVIHRQSIFHSIVEFVDGGMMAQMGVPDMKLPIQYALTYPQRLEGIAARLNLAEVGRCTFEELDEGRMAAVSLGHEAVRRAGTMGAVLNGANEVAVNRFLEARTRFGDIIPIVREVMDNHTPVQNPTLEEILQADRWARMEADRCLTSIS